jgi:hypothetical protein
MRDLVRMVKRRRQNETNATKASEGGGREV